MELTFKDQDDVGGGDGGDDGGDYAGMADAQMAILLAFLLTHTFRSLTVTPTCVLQACHTPNVHIKTLFLLSFPSAQPIPPCCNP